MTETDDLQNTPEARVRELLERGIAQVKAGEHDLGMAAFEDAGRRATDAGLTALAACSIAASSTFSMGTLVPR